MCVPPVTEMDAMPNQPVLPYAALHTSTRPGVGRQFFGRVEPATTVVSRTVDLVQSLLAPARLASQALETLSPSLTVNGLLVRAQWYPFHEWVACAVAGAIMARAAAVRAEARTRVRISELLLHEG